MFEIRCQLRISDAELASSFEHKLYHSMMNIVSTHENWIKWELNMWAQQVKWTTSHGFCMWMESGRGDARLYTVSLKSQSNVILAWPLLHVLPFIIKVTNPYLCCPCAWPISIIFIGVVQGLMLCLHYWYLGSWKREPNLPQATGDQGSNLQRLRFVSCLHLHMNSMRSRNGNV